MCRSFSFPVLRCSYWGGRDPELCWGVQPTPLPHGAGDVGSTVGSHLVSLLPSPVPEVACCPRGGPAPPAGTGAGVTAHRCRRRCGECLSSYNKWLWRNPWEKWNLGWKSHPVYVEMETAPQTEEENKIQDEVRRPSLPPSLLRPGQSRGTPPSLPGLRPPGGSSSFRLPQLQREFH